MSRAAVLTPPHRALAAAVGEAAAGRLAAQKLVEELRTSSTDPDRLFFLHYQVQTSPDRLKAFFRELQREIERGGQPDA